MPAVYAPLARKYRPHVFDELIGQPHVTETLTRAIESGRLAQAYLFTGQRGVGKTSAARILARCLNCAKGPTVTPCGTCPSCTALTQGNSLDVLEIDGASNRGIDDIRELREQVKFAPVEGRYKLYIIDEVHQITPDAFNALLKTLEEPPTHVKFIFATTAVQKVPSTILSRCQRFDFRRIETATAVTALARLAKLERIKIAEEALSAIARCSDGSLRDAEVMLEQLASFCDGPIQERDVTTLLGAVEQETLLRWTGAIIDKQAPQALTLLATQVEQGKDVIQVLVSLLLHLRNLLILRTVPAGASRTDVLGKLVDAPAEQLATLDEQAGRLSAAEWLLMAQVLTGAYDLARRTPFSQVVLEMALIKLLTRESWTSLDEIRRQLAHIAAQAPVPPAHPPLPPSAKPSPAAKPQPIHPLPAPRATVSPSLAAVTEQWPKVIERIGQQKMSLAAYLMNSRPVSLEGSVLQIGLPAFALHREILSLPESVRVIGEALTSLLERTYTIEFTTLPEPPVEPAAAAGSPEAPAAASSVPLVQDIVNLFNATVVQTPPQPQP